MRKEFGGLVATDDVDFTIPRGAIVALIGPNGAGKTTFFNQLTGVYKPTVGLDPVRRRRRIVGMPPHAIIELGIGRTFQNIRLFQQMTALENVLVGMHCRLKGGILGSILRTPRVRREEAEAASARASSSRTAAFRGGTTSTPASLPYGDQRRLEVARALATEPKLLLLDEPTAGMNPQETAEFTAFVGELRDEQGPDHAPHRARHEGRHGRLRAHHRARLRGEDRRGHAGGDPGANERVIEAYLGKRRRAA